MDQLFKHSDQLEKLYEAATGILGNKSAPDSKIQKFMDMYEEKAKWFEKAKAGSLRSNAQSFTCHIVVVCLQPACFKQATRTTSMKTTLCSERFPYPSRLSLVSLSGSSKSTVGWVEEQEKCQGESKSKSKGCSNKDCRG